jgi:hypothetical protein
MEYPHFNPHPSCASRLLPFQSYVFNVAYGVGKAGGAWPWPCFLPLQCPFLLLFLAIAMPVSSSLSFRVMPLSVHGGASSSSVPAFASLVLP